MKKEHLIFILIWITCHISLAQTIGVDIDDQTQNRALVDNELYLIPEWDQLDFSEIVLIQEPFQIPAYHLYNQLWDTMHIRSTVFEIPFFQNSLKINLIENHNNPFAFPCSGNLILDYGFHKKVFHAGVDFAETKGAPVVACFDGVVRVARYYNDYGKVVVIRHYNGLETVYAHLDQMTVVPGQIVNAGQLVGNAGNSGNTIETILHFEIRLFNQLINPNKVIDFINRKLKDDQVELLISDFNMVPVVTPDLIRMDPIYRNVPYPEKTKDNPKFHVVKSGDTLFKIARIYNTTVEQLIKWNNLKGDGANLQLDQKIRVQ